MDYWYRGPLASDMPFGIELIWLLGVLAIWELYWKGRSLWLAAQRKETGWFIALLIVNSVGILPLLYLYVFSKKDARKS